MIDSDVDCLTETLNQIINFDYPPRIFERLWIYKVRNPAVLLYKELISLRTFLSHSEETRYTVDKVKALVTRIKDVATEVDDMVDLFITTSSFMALKDVMQKIQAIKRDISEFDNHIKPNVLNDTGGTSRVNTILPKEDKIVGFDVDARQILDRLVGDQKKLDVISIVGMGGLGKTTLAKRSYDDPYVLYHFYIRGWVTVSQTYQKRDLLFSICTSLSLTNAPAGEMSSGKLCEVLFKGLKGKRYLIVIDDIWSVDAWNDIRICFPDDNIGSRILVTSRLINVALHMKPDSPPHLLRFLTVEESWNLLQHKVFTENGTCPVNLQETGKQISERCRGLPLAILVISGLLAKTEKTVDWWTRVLNSMGSYIDSNPERYMNTLALSYIHLPLHLKSCFLYFGAFPEDFKINVRKLMWLWVAEGFVKPGYKNVAEEYLIDLIERSMVIVDQKRSDGGVKVCRVHDLLHNLCLEKAKEESFLHEINMLKQLASSPNTSIRRSFIHIDVLDYVSSKPSSVSTRSILCFNSSIAYEIAEIRYSSLFKSYRHIRVLELSSVSVSFLPEAIGQLIQLRYLSFLTSGDRIPNSISTLHNLQTLAVYGIKKTVAFKGKTRFCRMANLLHMCIRPCLRSTFWIGLPKIQTICMLHISKGRDNMLRCAPKLRKLGCVVSQEDDGSVPLTPLDFLIHLNKLKIKIENDNFGLPRQQACFTNLNCLPHNLRKVTFLNCLLPWTALSELGRLPNLEIMKLLCGNFQGSIWDTNDGGFQKLKYLKIHSHELAEWNTITDHFPQLERLIMYGCTRLKEIPMCIGDIPTMGLIELWCPSTSAANSAKQIIEEQQNLGNDGLKLIIYDHTKEDSQVLWKPFLGF